MGKSDANEAVGEKASTGTFLLSEANFWGIKVLVRKRS